MLSSLWKTVFMLSLNFQYLTVCLCKLKDSGWDVSHLTSSTAWTKIVCKWFSFSFGRISTALRFSDRRHWGRVSSYAHSGKPLPIVCTDSTLCSGQQKRKLSFTLKVSLCFDVKGFIITKYRGNVKWMQWEVLGYIFLEPVKVSGGTGARWCGEMKVDSFRYSITWKKAHF